MDPKKDAKEYLERADAESTIQNLTRAIVFWTRSIRLDKDNIDGYFDRARKLHKQKKYQEATRLYKRILLMDPDNELVIYYFAFALDMLGKPHESIEMYQRMISLNPYNVDGYYNLGILFTQTGNYEQAQRHYARVLELQPSDAYLVSNCIGYSYFLRGEFVKAIPELQKSISLNETYTLAYFNLNIVLFCENRCEEAEKYFTDGMKTLEEGQAKRDRIEGIVADYTLEKTSLENKLNKEVMSIEEKTMPLRIMVNGLANIINLLSQPLENEETWE